MRLDETDTEIAVRREDREIARAILQRMMIERLPHLYETWRASGRFPAILRHEATHEAAHAVIAEAIEL